MLEQIISMNPEVFQVIVAPSQSFEASELHYLLGPWTQNTNRYIV